MDLPPLPAGVQPTDQPAAAPEDGVPGAGLHPSLFCERGCGSEFYRPDMRDRHQRHCSHALIGQVRVEDPDALEIFASDEEMEGSAPPTEPVSSLSCPPEGAARTRLWTPAAGGTSPRGPSRRRGRGSGGRGSPGWLAAAGRGRGGSSF